MRSDVEIKPCSEACERNKYAIEAALCNIFDKPGDVLEIGSGTGQHAVHFAARLPHLTWHCSDLPDRHPGINAWIDESTLENVMRPIAMDVSGQSWPARKYAYAFSSNTAHIMSWPNVACMFSGLSGVLAQQAQFALYGPFNVDGRFTSKSNREFDQALRAEDPNMGIRNLEDVAKLAADYGFSLWTDIAMPANNRLLVFAKA